MPLHMTKYSKNDKKYSKNDKSTNLASLYTYLTAEY